jgi:hypothetical protein
MLIRAWRLFATPRLQEAERQQEKAECERERTRQIERQREWAVQREEEIELQREEEVRSLSRHPSHSLPLPQMGGRGAQAAACGRKPRPS